MNPLFVLCLTLLFFHLPFLMGKKGGRIRLPTKKSFSNNRGRTHSNTGSQGGHGSTSQGSYPKQPVQTVPKDYPRGHTWQQGGGFNYYPRAGSTYGGGYGRHPSNRILSPGYGGSFGYTSYSVGRGSPFSRSVQGMNIHPNDRSRGFGHTAVKAAAGGAIVGMALGYGLGRFPRPPYEFHNQQDERHYNNYMYRTYGRYSTDRKDYSRDYKYQKIPQSYDQHMKSCMKRNDLLSSENQNGEKKPAGSVATSSGDANFNVNATKANRSAGNDSPSSEKSTPHPLTPQSAEEDDTVSIVEIGYPALIEQLKVRICAEMFLDYAHEFLVEKPGGAQGLQNGPHGILAVILGAALMLINSNAMVGLH